MEKGRVLLWRPTRYEIPKNTDGQPTLEFQGCGMGIGTQGTKTGTLRVKSGNKGGSGGGDKAAPPVP